MEQNTKAIILNTREYKEADKLATIFSRDLGKICVRFVGVAKPKAKLKANAQPFSHHVIYITPDELHQHNKQTDSERHQEQRQKGLKHESV